MRSDIPARRWEEQSALNKVIETAFRLEQAMDKMTLWEKWYENRRGGGETAEQQGRHSTVHRFL